MERGRSLAFAFAATLVLGMVMGLGACVSDARFDVRYSPSFVKPKTVSVLGVFKDGRMNAEAWEQLRPAISQALAGTCELAVGERLAQESPGVVTALDDATRANGVTDELVRPFAPMAQGELILVLTVAGRPPRVVGDAGTSRPPPSSSRFTPGGRGRNMSSSSRVRLDHNEYEVQASLFSVARGESVGLVAMAYTGSTVEDALDRFRDRLAAELPGARCAGWDFGVKVSEEAIRAVGEGEHGP